MCNVDALIKSEVDLFYTHLALWPCVSDNVSFETVYLKFYEVCAARI